MADSKISDFTPVGAVDDTDEFVLARAGANNKIAGQQMPGFELDYTQITSSVNVTQTSEGSADTIVTASAVTFDGSTVVMVEFFAIALFTPGGGGSRGTQLWLFQDGSSIGRIGDSFNGGGDQIAGTCHVFRRLTPTAASHTYSIRGTVTAGTGTVRAGAGGSGNFMPAFIRILKA